MQDNNIEKMQNQTPIMSDILESSSECGINSTIPDKENVEECNSYGKFKSAESLFEAYKNLEKEFTKKCQLLKNYEKSIDNDSLVQKLVEVNPNLSDYADELSSFIKNDTNSTIALAKCLLGRVNEPCHIINNEDFLEKYVYQNSDITQKVIDNYLNSLLEKRSPLTISSHGYAYVSPSHRPKTLADASKMAKNYIENRRF